MHPTLPTPGDPEGAGIPPAPAPVEQPPAPARIVGVGASAGGLEAFEQFFPAVPPETGLAFVVVQHLDPTKPGILPELIQRLTPMPVVEAGDGMAIEPGRVYVIPPNRYLAVEGGRLRLRELQTGTHVQMTVDALFRSLAVDQGDRAVAVVLSGMGTDGTLGIAAIKEQFGLVLVQEPESAPFDGMPHSAVGTGLADYVAPAGELPGLLLGHIEREGAIVPAKEPSSAETCARVLSLLRSRTGHDFSLYKANTVRRRVQRRMAVHRLERLDEYLQYLRENQGEVALLFRELLIGVTQFFRDSAAWDVLRDRVIPELLERKQPDTQVRAWVPGCSTGEEAFSLAIILLEAAGDDRGIAVQIFATDIDREAIAAARQALYPPNIEADVSPERLRRFFSRQEDGRYRVKKEVRDLVVFAEQDVATDPPFTRLDLLSCRNLLIYFSPELQQRVMPVFRYSLLPGGVLFLGSAETVGSALALFEPVDPRWKIYRRTGEQAAYPEPFAVPYSRHPPELARAGRSSGQALADRLQALLLRDFAAPGVVVNERGDIVHVSGRIGRFLEPPPGRAALNIFAMARNGLQPGLEAAIHRAFLEHAPVTADALPLETDGGTVPVDVLVRPVGESPDLRELMIVVFEEGRR
ncbi:MAG TPA: chemotaxis protein CheB, partial [Methanoregulaceae archaeon]|nr:chemotaxis protein CheB [Methanoregulaceae archaeon]